MADVNSVMSALAKVGIVAVIDEITGYQEVRDRNELQKMLLQHLSPDLVPWAELFPNEFYNQIARLDIDSEKENIGKIANNYIFNYLPVKQLEEIRSKLPKDFVDNDTASLKQLDNQLLQTTALMKASENWDEFKHLFERAMGKPPQGMHR